MRRAFRGVALAGAALLGGEAALRAVGFERPPPSFLVFTGPTEGIEARILDHPDVASDGSLFWRLRPNRALRLSDGLPYEINERGFRGRVLTEPKDPVTRRVVAMGDSCTFGLGVLLEESWPARLEAVLAARGRTAEVGNAGIPGYTSFQGSRLLESEGSAWRADAIVFYFGDSNEYRPAIRTDRERGGTRRGIPRLFAGLRLLQAARTLVPPRPLPSEPGTVRVPLAEFEEDLAALVAGARSLGAVPLLVVPPSSPALEREFPIVRSYQEAVRRVAARAHTALADAAAAFEATADRSALFLDLPHPSAAGHAVLAESVAAALAGAAY